MFPSYTHHTPIIYTSYTYHIPITFPFHLPLHHLGRCLSTTQALHLGIRIVGSWDRGHKKGDIMGHTEYHAGWWFQPLWKILVMQMGPFFAICHGYPLVICYIAIENGHWNGEFYHEKNDGSFNSYVNVYQRVPLLVGGWATPLKNDGVRQLGWWHSQDMEQ